MAMSSDRRRVYRLVMAALVAALVAAVLTAGGGRRRRPVRRRSLARPWRPHPRTAPTPPATSPSGRPACCSTCACPASSWPSSWAPRCPPPAPRSRASSATRWPSPTCWASRPEPAWAPPSPSSGSLWPPSASTPCPCWPSSGATLAAFLVYRLATFGGRTGGASLLLSGVAVGSTLTAIMSFLMVATERDLHTVVVWLMGGLTTATWTKVYITLPVVAAGFIYMMLMSRRMNLLLMGEERARELGVDSQRTRRNLMVVAALTTAAAVAFSGLIGFIGLMVPHIMRLLVGPDHRRLLPAAALFGALLLLARRHGGPHRPRPGRDPGGHHHRGRRRALLPLPAARAEGGVR